MKVKSFILAWRILKTGFINLFRNAWLTIAATAVMVVALTIISIAVVLNVTANNAIDVIARDLKASIYLEDQVSEQARQAIQDEIRVLEYVDNVEFISKTDAQDEFAENFNDDTDILQALALAGDDALPSSFRITVADLERMTELQTYAEQTQYSASIRSVSLGNTQTNAQQTIDQAAAAQRFINTASITSALVLSIISVMIIFNTIRMAIYTRRDEIAIMKLIGATPDYIRGPFLVEAALYGVAAGIIAVSVTYSLIVSLLGNVASQPEFSQTYAFFTQSNVVMAMATGSVLVGILIGLVSSMLAMEKHLKLKHW